MNTPLKTEAIDADRRRDRASAAAAKCIQCGLPGMGSNKDMSQNRMATRTKRMQVGLIVVVIVIYLAVLLRNVNESGRRSLQLNEVPIAGDHVSIAIRIVDVDPTTSQMTARIGFRLDGYIAKDAVTPTADLKFFVNGIRGPQEIDFPAGRRINPIEAVFSLDGNANQYPFDRYESSIWMMVTKNTATSQPSQPRMGKADNKNLGKKNAGRRNSDEKEIPPEGSISDLILVTPHEREPLPIVSSIAASIPGLKIEGQSVARTGQGIEGFKLDVRRADNVIVVSILIMVLMMGLAMSVLLMSLQALNSSERSELLPLSLCVTLLFGLPALRNTQPAVPPLGAFGDYLSFLWAEQIVAVSAIILIWTWLIRERRHS